MAAVPGFERSRAAAQENVETKQELQKIKVAVQNTLQYVDALEEGQHMSKYAADTIREKLRY
jgi:hypothetical protein